MPCARAGDANIDATTHPTTAIPACLENVFVIENFPGWTVTACGGSSRRFTDEAAMRPHDGPSGRQIADLQLRMCFFELQREMGNSDAEQHPKNTRQKSAGGMPTGRFR